MEKARMNLDLSPAQLGLLRRLVKGETLWQRDLPAIGLAFYFGDPPKPLEVVSAQDVLYLVRGEGAERALIEFRPHPPSSSAGTATELGALYAMRAFKDLV